MGKIFGNVLNLSLFAVLFVLCIGFVAIRVSGFGSFVVTGGSMEPNIHKGSLVLVEPVTPQQVNVGDVITFQHYGQTTTHRVIAVAQTEQGPAFTTKGDANTVADPDAKTFPGQVGLVRVTVPAIGYAIVYLQAYWRLALSLIAAVVFFACAGLIVFRKETTEVERPVATKRVARRAVAAITVETDQAWEAHLAWVRRSAQRKPQVA